MSDVMAVPGPIEAESEPGTGQEMSLEEFQSTVRNECEQAENWLRQDVTPERERGLRYYNGECDVPAQENRSEFVMRVVRDSIEQAIPALMRIFTGGTEIVSFQARDISEESDMAAREATEAFHHVYRTLNPGWKNTLEGLKDATKAKNLNFSAYIKEEVRVKPEPFYGPVEMLEARLQDENIDIEEMEMRSETRIVPGMFGPEAMEVPMVEAVLRVKETKSKICIDAYPPEEQIIDREATGMGHREYRISGRRCVKTVSDAVDMGVPWEVAIEHSGSSAERWTSSRNDQIKRARSERSGTLYEHNANDQSTEPLVIYDLFMYVDKDGDGHAELRHIIGIGDGPAYIHDDELAEEQYFFTAPAIAIEHNVIGDSMADNLTDLQDIETQMSRNINNNASQVANPRPITVDGQVDIGSVRSTVFGAEVKTTQLGAVDWLVTPFIGDKLLMVRESYNETRAERTGISKESQGLAAQNLQASSEIGVLAVLGAGNTQPEMIAATIAHYAFVPMARYVLKLIKQVAMTEEGMTIRTSQGLKRINPQMWPDDMDVEVKVGLGTGTRDENLATLNQTAAKQMQAIQAQEAMGAPDLITDAAKLAETNHRILKLSGIGDSTSFWTDPDQVKARLAQMRKQAAKTPPPPSDTDKKIAADAQSDQLKADTDLTKQAMGDENDALIQDKKNEAKLLEVAVEAELSQQQDKDINLG